jgi:hypothetical protein
MSVYIIKESGVEVNRIVSSDAFMEANYPDAADYELIPDPPTPTHLETFTTVQLHESFTSSEMISALTSTDGQVQAQAQLLSMKRDKIISKDDIGYQTAIGDLRTDGILDSDTAIDYLLGIPVSRL